MDIEVEDYNHKKFIDRKFHDNELYGVERQNSKKNSIYVSIINRMHTLNEKYGVHSNKLQYVNELLDEYEYRDRKIKTLKLIDSKLKEIENEV
jgi:hypothetical protein